MMLFKSEAKPVEVFDEYPVIIKNVSFYKIEKTREVVKTVAKSLKFTHMAATALSVYLSPNVALMIVKSIQVFDYIRLINIESPENLDNFLEIFNTDIFDIAPNPFLREEFEDLGEDSEVGTKEI